MIAQVLLIDEFVMTNFCQEVLVSPKVKKMSSEDPDAPCVELQYEDDGWSLIIPSPRSQPLDSIWVITLRKQQYVLQLLVHEGVDKAVFEAATETCSALPKGICRVVAEYAGGGPLRAAQQRVTFDLHGLVSDEKAPLMAALWSSSGGLRGRRLWIAYGRRLLEYSFGDEVSGPELKQDIYPFRTDIIQDVNGNVDFVPVTSPIQGLRFDEAKRVLSAAWNHRRINYIFDQDRGICGLDQLYI